MPPPGTSAPRLRPVLPPPHATHPAHPSPATCYLLPHLMILPAVHAQATDAGVAPARASLINGAVAGGAAGSYQGAAFDHYVVMFARNVRSPAAPVTAATYPLPPAPAPAPAVHVLTGLVPFASYALMVDPVAGTATLLSGPGGAGALLATADNAGVARF